MRALFYKNIGYSFVAQFIQLALSTTVTLSLPLLMNIESFGYWQLFIFYAQYGAFFHFGLIDGIYLREGGKKYSDLNYRSIGFQLKCLFLINLIIFLIYVILAFFVGNVNRSYVIVLSGIMMLVGNTTNFFSMLLSSVNEIKTTSIGRICFSLPFLLFVASSFLFLRIGNFKVYIAIYILCYACNLIYCLHHSKEIVKGAFGGAGWEYKKEMTENFKNGINLLIANITGMLLLGITRFFIDSKWGIEVFSMVSYSLVVANFVLMFISEVSAVLYPELRTMGKPAVDKFFTTTHEILLLFTPLVLLVYYPISLLIDNFLPDYGKAVSFMVYLLPVCVYEAKVKLQINTYFKVYNRPREMMVCNIISLLFGVLLSAMAIYYFENIALAVISMPLTILFQYIISLARLRSDSYLNDLKMIMPEGVLMVIFILDNHSVKSVASNIMVFLVAVIVYYGFVRTAANHTLYKFRKKT